MSTEDRRLRRGVRPGRVVVVSSPRCRDCRALLPIVDEVAARHRSVDIDHLDVTAAPARARELAVHGTPTLIGYAGDRETFRVLGRRSAGEVERLFAGLAAGEPVTPARGAESGLRIGTGVALLGLGITTGGWLLAVVGVALGGYGLRGLLRRAE